MRLPLHIATSCLYFFSLKIPLKRLLSIAFIFVGQILLLQRTYADSCKTVGPQIKNVRPYSYTDSKGRPRSEIREDQTFVLLPSCKIAPESVNSKFSVQVKGASLSYPLAAVSEEARLAELIRLKIKDPKALVMKPKGTLPAGKTVLLVAGSGLRSTGYQVSSKEIKQFVFKVRPAFTMRTVCGQQYKNGKCNPLGEAFVLFPSPLSKKIRNRIFLSDEHGQKKAGRYGSFWLDPGSPSYGVIFKGPFNPQTTWKINFPDSISDTTGRELQNAESAPKQIIFGDLAPLVKFDHEFSILEATANPLLPLHLRNVEEPGGHPPTVVAKRLSGPMTIWQTLIRVEQERRKQPEKRASLFSEMKGEKISYPKIDKGKAFELVGIPLKKPGFYLLEASSKTLSEKLGLKKTFYSPTAALVTDLALHFKWGLDRSMIWVTSLSNGKPAANVAVSVYDCNGGNVWTGNTDEAGRAFPEGISSNHDSFSCKWPKSLKNYSHFKSRYLVVAQTDDDFSFLISSQNKGIEHWRFNLPPARIWGEKIMHTFYSQPIIRRGETIHFKHFFRRRTSAGLKTLREGERPKHVTLQHAGSRKEFKLPLTWSDSGDAHSQWSIPELAQLGRYEIRTKWQGQKFFDSFEVLDFKPNLSQAEIAIGSVSAREDTLRLPFDIQVDYLAGGGASNLPVKVLLKGTPLPFSAPPEYENFIFSGSAQSLNFPSQYWQASQHGYRNQRSRTKLDPRIKTFELDSQGGLHSEFKNIPEPKVPTLYQLQAQYQDPNGEIRTATSHHHYLPAGKTIAISGSKIFHTRKDFAFKVLVLNQEGKAVADEPIEVQLFEKKAYSHRKKLLGKFYGYENQNVLEPGGIICSGRTSAAGILACRSELPLAGQLILEARSTENPAVSVNIATWVAEGDEWWFAPQDHDRLDILTESASYDAGETARMQIRIPYAKATALVTIEREGVLDSFVTEVTSSSPWIDVPIKATYSPNVYVTVSVVRGRLARNRNDFFADFSKPAFKYGVTNIGVGQQNHKITLAASTDKKSYQVGDQINFTINASRNRRLLRGAEIAVAVVDEGVLALKDNRSTNLLASMLGTRPLSTRYFNNMIQVLGKRHFGLKANPFGGGGGVGSNQARDSFEGLLYWNPALKTDDNGVATGTFPTNDSVTSFRLIAVSSSGSALFGSTTTRFQVNKDFSLFSGAPATVRTNDVFNLNYTLRNNSEKERTLEVSGKVGNGQNLNTQTLQVKSGQSARISWPEVRLEKAGKTVLSTQVKAGQELLDSLDTTIAVAEAVPLRTSKAELIQLDSSIQKDIKPSKGALKNRGTVEVHHSEGVLGMLKGVQDYMKAYPYSCLEQKVSKALATENSQMWQQIENSMNTYADAGGLLKYFPSQQHGSLALTSYVLSLAHEADRTIPNQVKSKALKALEDFVSGKRFTQTLKSAHQNERAVLSIDALEALARYKVYKIDYLALQLDEIANLPTYSVVQLRSLLSFYPTSKALKQSLATVEAELDKRLKLHDTMVSLKSGNDEHLWWAMVSPELTLIKLFGLSMKIPKFHKASAKLLNTLALGQRRGHWALTTSNSWGAVLLRKYDTQVTPQKPVAVSLTSGDNKYTLDPGETVKILLDGNSTGLEFETPANGYAPWILIQRNEALPRIKPVSSGYTLTRKVVALERKKPDSWSVGDVLKIELTIKSDGTRTWVALTDPVPPGAAILNANLKGLGLVQKSNDTLRPTFVERSFQEFKAYFDMLPAGEHTVSYQIRLNTSGKFQLPSSRIEAMYSPSMFGETGRSDIEISK